MYTLCPCLEMYNTHTLLISKYFVYYHTSSKIVGISNYLALGAEVGGTVSNFSNDHHSYATNENGLHAQIAC